MLFEGAMLLVVGGACVRVWSMAANDLSTRSPTPDDSSAYFTGFWAQRARSLMSPKQNPENQLGNSQLSKGQDLGGQDHMTSSENFAVFLVKP